MIVDLKPYPKMKDSGVPWLGDVPSGWSTRRLKTVFREVDHRSGTGKEPLLSLRMQQGLVDHHAMGGKPIPPSSLTNYKRTEPGEIVMNRMRAAAGLFAATLSVGLVSPDYAVLRPRVSAELRYFVHLFRTPQMMSAFRLESRGLGTGESGFLRLYTERFGMLEAPVPPLSEQSAIVHFLDHADRRIRRYIRAKQKLTKLLEEQKQAIIHRAVTRGLAPNVRLKPSGLGRLGDVPEHWEVTRLKSRLLRPMRNGLFKKKDAFGSGVPLVNVADIFRENFQVEPSSLDRVQATPDEVRTYRVRSGDLLFVRSSLKLEGTGRSAVALDCAPDTVFECHLVQGRPDPARINARFLAVLLNSFGLRHYLISRANVVTMATIAQDVLATCPIWLPTLAEQLKLLEHIDRETASLDAVSRQARHEIALFQEYRTSLIADVVTGKLDVREASAHLPDEPETPEAEGPPIDGEGPADEEDGQEDDHGEDADDT